jgi:hypothetical protein
MAGWSGRRIVWMLAALALLALCLRAAAGWARDLLVTMHGGGGH